MHSCVREAQVCRLTFQSDSVNIKSRASCTYWLSGRMCTDLPVHHQCIMGPGPGVATCVVIVTEIINNAV